MKFSRQIVIGSLMISALSACSSSTDHYRQAKDSFEYTEESLTPEWQVLPTARRQYYRLYQIPEGDYQGEIGKMVDIRPPQEILQLIPGARYSDTENGVVIWSPSAQEDAKVWASIGQMLEKRHIPLRVENDVQYETDWVDLTTEDEKTSISSRYDIQKVEIEQEGGLGILVGLAEFKQGDEIIEITPEIMDRYSRNMVNYITSQYDKQIQEEEKAAAAKSVQNIQFVMSTDQSGLPVIIARAPYSVMWERMAEALPRLGFEITSRSEPQGEIDTSFSAQGDEFYKSLSVEPISLNNKDYIILLGDLNNRTSINITDEDDKPIDEDELESVMSALDALFVEQSYNNGTIDLG